MVWEGSSFGNGILGKFVVLGLCFDLRRASPSAGETFSMCCCYFFSLLLYFMFLAVISLSSHITFHSYILVVI